MRASLHVAALALALGAACAHAPASPPAAAVLLPAAPAVPRARHAASVRLAQRGARPAWWRTALRILTGAEVGGAAPDALLRPFDAALRDDGSFVLADPDRPGVLAYGADGTFAAEISCPDRAWSSPMSVAVAPDGAVWVADAGDASVVRWSEGRCAVFQPEGLERPTGIALAGDRVAVVDPPSHRVLFLSLAGEVIARAGSQGTGEGKLHFPTDVAAAPDGSVLVVDALNFRIVRLAADGRWLGAFGARGESGAGLARPKGIAVAADGTIFVADAQRDVVLAFGPDGALRWTLGEPGDAPGQFAHPAGLSTRGGRLVVADSFNARAEILELLGDER